MYGMSVLAGYGQGFLLIAIVAVVYAAFLSLFVSSKEASMGPLGRWRPLAVSTGAVVLGAGLGAFQILETLRAMRRSIRAALMYPFFVSGSFTPQLLLKSLMAPLYTDRFADVTTYVPLLVLALAALACVAAFRRGDDAARRDPRVVF